MSSFVWVVGGLTFSSEVQMIFDPPFSLLQLLGQLSVLPTWKPTCAETEIISVAIS